MAMAELIEKGYLIDCGDGYEFYEAPEEEQNFPMVMEMLRAGEVREDDDQYQSPLDELFERLEMKNPEHTHSETSTKGGMALIYR